MPMLLRLATKNDIPAMHRVRLAVRENKLTSSVITEADYLPAMEETGRGWVAEQAGQIVGFSVGNAQTGNIWALFIDPNHEAKGIGRQLHDVMVNYLFNECEPKLERLNLSTASGTRAEQFYRKAGWTQVGEQVKGEVFFELSMPL
jgi:ribosomal protein S18 acetylase RimI-like enzyme